jgi:hypothetical protein
MPKPALGWRILLPAFALANAVLYSSLLPLWEGFDEPWHYGYVQHFATFRSLPVLGKTPLSREVWDSMLSCPVSHVVAAAWPELQTFDAYAKLTPEARRQQRSVLDSLPPEGAVASAHANYEVQQAPLAYAILAVPDWLLRHLPVTTRILWLRTLNSLLTAAVSFLAAAYLFRTLGLPPPYRALGLFCLFACQMYWATTAHVSSDGIALALSIWYFAALAAFASQPDLPRALRLALATALGLLAKAYFLPLATAAVAVVLWRRWRSLPAFLAILAALAGPWYLRNLLLYHNVSGLLMASADNSPRAVLAAVVHVDWSRTFPYMLRATLWTGNNSFTSFSTVTLNVLLALLSAGLLLYAAQALRSRRMAAAERSVLGAVAVFGAAVVYVVGNDVLLLHGASAGASPWYTEPLVTPLLALSLTGMSRLPRLGRPIAVCVCLLWTYIAIATYVAKLIPLYGAYPAGRSTLRELLRWYTSQGADLTSMLSTVSLAPPMLIYVETAVVTALAVALAVRLVRAL